MKGKDINRVSNKDLSNRLHSALEEDSVQSIKSLFKSGELDINDTFYGQTLICSSIAVYNSKKISLFLLKLGCDINERNEQGEKCLTVLIKEIIDDELFINVNKIIQMIELMLENGYKINVDL